MGTRGLITGVDIGTTTAVALVDLKGRLVGMKSQKHFLHHEMQQFIQSFGQPVLFATDVVKVPAQKLAAGFGVRVEAPQKDLQRKEKSGLVGMFLKNFHKKTENFHEVSALAAAIVCYNKHAGKFRWVDRQLAGLNLVGRSEEIKKRVLYGVSVNRILEGRR